jgi:DNA/RNA endonuclease YhcR with UshA esterase domain
MRCSIWETMNVSKARVLVAALVIAASPAVADNSLTAAEAAEHIGEQAIVCGAVVSANYVSKSKGQPTFLNLDQPYPRQIFTIVIWGSDRRKFGAPEITLLGKRVCVTGTIKTYRGKAEIVATDPQQLVTK